MEKRSHDGLVIFRGDYGFDVIFCGDYGFDVAGLRKASVAFEKCLKEFHRMSVLRKSRVELDLAAPAEAGKNTYAVYFMCDSCIGCDQESQRSRGRERKT